MTTSVSGTGGITFPDSTTQNTGAFNGGLAFRNRIINGGMVIDQRNAGASVTPTTGQYTVDRWAANLSQASKFSVQQNAGSVTPPAGFRNYLGATSLSAYTVAAGDFFGLYQIIEGFNTADFSFGTANAKTFTLSFQVYSSLTGTFGGAVFNNGQTRSYPFTYSIPVANTWTSISITIPGDTSGTWVGATNSAGLAVQFNLGTGTTYSGPAGSWASATYVSATGAQSVVGTNGATFYITGVQLEKSPTATSFDYRPYGTELALCQRYYEKTYNQSLAIGTADDTSAVWGSVNTADTTMFPLAYAYKATKRTAPTVTVYNSITGTVNTFQAGGTNYTVSGTYGSDAVLGRIYSTTGMASGTYARACVVASAEL